MNNLYKKAFMLARLGGLRSSYLRAAPQVLQLT